MQSRKRVVLYSLVGLLLIGLLVFAVVTSLTGSTKPKVSKPTISKISKPNPKPSTQGKVSQAQPGNNVTAPENPTPVSPSAPASQPATDTALANTGPGQTVAAFGVVTVVAVASSHLYQRRKLA